MSEVGQMLMIMLMLTGGSPGSTAGGMKTTTLAVLVSSALSVFRKKEHAHFFQEEDSRQYGKKCSYDFFNVYYFVPRGRHDHQRDRRNSVNNGVV